MQRSEDKRARLGDSALFDHQRHYRYLLEGADDREMPLNAAGL
jgi:hypothetical protein